METVIQGVQSPWQALAVCAFCGLFAFMAWLFYSLVKWMLNEIGKG